MASANKVISFRSSPQDVPFKTQIEQAGRILFVTVRPNDSVVS